jgi:hypothetical protein
VKKHLDRDPLPPLLIPEVPDLEAPVPEAPTPAASALEDPPLEDHILEHSLHLRSQQHCTPFSAAPVIFGG